MSMRNGKMKAGIVGVVCAVLLMGVQGVNAVSTGVEADSFGGTDVDGTVNFSGAGGSITIQFGAQGAPPAPVAATVVADGAGFSGDYSDVDELSFTITTDGSKPKGAAVVLKAAGTDRVWYNKNVAIPDEAYVAAATTVSLDLDAGWVCYWPGDKEALWEADLANVAMVGVRIGQGSLDAESYTVANLVLDGGAPANLVPARVLAHFGVTSLSELTEAQLAQDSDGDGMSDLLEVWAGTDPNNANSIFAAKIVSVNPVTIEWPCAEEVTYTLLRAADLTSGFSVLDSGIAPDADDVAAGAIQYPDEDAGAGMNFYRVVIE